MSDNIENKTHLGEAFYLDTSSRKIIAKGYGHIDLTSFNLTAKLHTIIPGTFSQILVVIKTSVGYVAPFALYSEVLFSESHNTVSYGMRAYLQWPISRDITHPLDYSQTIDISIRAKHAQDSTRSTIHPRGISEQLVRNAVSTSLGSYEYQDCYVAASSSYTIGRYTEKVRGKTQFELSTFIKYQFKCHDKLLSFNDIGKILLAFKLYWICYFDPTDCCIESINLGKDIQLQLVDKNLYAASTDNPEYKSIVRAGTDLNIEPLTKMAHFFLNPNRNKKLGSSSKIGLAFSRIIDYRFRTESELASMNIASLIFALQSLCEGIAEREIQKKHRASKQQITTGIKRAMEAIRSVEDELPKDVRDFYLRSEAEIYRLMARPTFMKSLEIALNKLEIDIKSYRSILKSIDNARRQIVHSEGYSVEFLLSLLTNTITQMDIGAKSERPQIVREDSEIDKLYELLRLMTIRYFEKDLLP